MDLEFKSNFEQKGQRSTGLGGSAMRLPVRAG